MLVGIIILAFWIAILLFDQVSQNKRIAKLEDTVIQIGINMDKLLESQSNDRARIHQLERELDV